MKLRVRRPSGRRVTVLIGLLAAALAGSAAGVAAADPPAPRGDLPAARADPTAPRGDLPAAGGDPLQSADCRRALESLQAQEVAAAAAARASAAADTHGRRVVADAEREPARRQAARICLASRADPPLPPQRLVRPPIAIAPLAVAPRAAAATAATAVPAPAPSPVSKPADKPYAITSCDPGGCWANDGSRLNRASPNLWGAHGICTVQGTLVQCP